MIQASLRPSGTPTGRSTPIALTVLTRRSGQAELPLAAQIEGMLFVAAEPVVPSQLAEALAVSASRVEAALQELENSLRPRGLRLQRQG